MAHASFLSAHDIRSHVRSLYTWMRQEKIDALYISSFDPYLSEYVPLEECHRYYVTGFTGSMAHVLMTADGRTRLYVDGRYHEQADLQTERDVVEVVKVGGGMSLDEALMADVRSLGNGILALEADRTPLDLSRQFESLMRTRILSNNELSSCMSFRRAISERPIRHLPKAVRGRDTEEKLAIVCADPGLAYFVSSLDDIAWMTNCRGYHLPNQSSFKARALVTAKRVHVFVDPGTTIDSTASSQSSLAFHEVDMAGFAPQLQTLASSLGIKKLVLDPSALNVFDYRLLTSVFSKDVISEKSGGLVSFRAIKDEGELAELVRSFDRSNKVVIETIRWFQSEIKAQHRVTECDLYEKANALYREQGAVEQSFTTISAIGANSSIIHFSTPSSSIVAKDDDIVLLDSGAYYEGGFATDITRTFSASGDSSKVPQKQKTIYTLVLKGHLQAMNAVFPEGTVGATLDALARTPINRAGYNYEHGTGHGVGINVHDGGPRARAGSTTPLLPGHVLSVEPGIYIPGYGGVRIENVVVVERHPQFPGMLHLKNLVWAGYDPSLIDRTLMNEEERRWLDEHEVEAKKRGLSLAR